MKIFAISDTHGYHDEVELKPADMIIHSGDISQIGTRNQILRFLDWFSNTEYKHKIFIAGNHDFYFEQESPDEIETLIPDNIHYLNDSGVNIDGLHIWGSPVQPWFHDWAFNKKRGKEIAKHWQIIPENTDLLLTHGPPYGVLDRVKNIEPVGCEDLLKRVKQVNPPYHVFGHIHECFGVKKIKQTTFINASFVDEHYIPKNQGIVFEWKKQ